MPSSYSSRLRLELVADGEQLGIWGRTTNKNLGTLLETAIAGFRAVPLPDSNYTLTAMSGADDQARYAFLQFTGVLTAPREVTAPAVSKTYLILNSTNQAVTLKTTFAAGVSIPAGRAMYVRCNGTAYLDAFDYITTLTAGTLATTGLASLQSLTVAALATLANVQINSGQITDTAIVNLPTPVNPGDAVNKTYVDTILAAIEAETQAAAVSAAQALASEQAALASEIAAAISETNASGSSIAAATSANGAAASAASAVSAALLAQEGAAVFADIEILAQQVQLAASSVFAAYGTYPTYDAAVVDIANLTYGQFFLVQQDETRRYKATIYQYLQQDENSLLMDFGRNDYFTGLLQDTFQFVRFLNGDQRLFRYGTVAAVDLNELEDLDQIDIVVDENFNSRRTQYRFEAQDVDTLFMDFGDEVYATGNMQAVLVFERYDDPQIVPVPATSTSFGRLGEFAVDSTFLYVGVANSQWKRITLEVF